jgi:hypothetical protein
VPLLISRLVVTLLMPLLRRIDVMHANGGRKPGEKTTEDGPP